MRSLVTGGAGFIGSNLVDQLLKIGHEVTVVDNEFSDAHDQFYWNPKAYNVNCDIRDYRALTNAFASGQDYVFHLAAEARIQPAIKNPIEAVSINSLGTCTVLQCAREAKVKRLIYSSTSSSYGMNPYPNVETQPDDCLNPYSVSKVNGEKLSTMYTDLFDLPTVILRLTIVGDGDQRRDFTHVSDVVNANIMAAISRPDPEACGQVYNVGTGTNYSVNEIAAMISDNTINIPPRIGESRITQANVDKIWKTFGWKSKVKLEDWIKGALS